MDRVRTSCLFFLTIATVTSLAGRPAFAQKVEPAFSATAAGVIGDNQLGIRPGSPFRTDFMLDPGLSATPSLSTDRLIRFLDPWRWHWIVGNPWDWLRGFIFEIPREIPGPDPGPLVLQAVFDDSHDMVMDMPGFPPQERGTAFVTTFMFRADSPFFKEGRLPTMEEVNRDFVKENSSFRVLDPSGRELLRGTIDSFMAAPSAEPCEGDTDGDGDVDATDVRTFRSDFGRNECPLM